MTGKTIELPQMLARREARSQEQQQFLTTHKAPLISFSMNIPGPVKTNQLIRKAFELGRKLLFSRLQEIHAEILAASEIHEDTGDELLLSVGNIEPEILKDIAVNIEEASEIGRLYDIDVMDSEGHKLSRSTFRKCLICDKQAQECARSRTHSVIEMQSAIENLLRRTFQEQES